MFLLPLCSTYNRKCVVLCEHQQQQKRIADVFPWQARGRVKKHAHWEEWIKTAHGYLALSEHSFAIRWANRVNANTMCEMRVLDAHCIMNISDYNANITASLCNSIRVREIHFTFFASLVPFACTFSSVHVVSIYSNYFECNFFRLKIS